MWQRIIRLVLIMKINIQQMYKKKCDLYHRVKITGGYRQKRGFESVRREARVRG